MHDSEYKPPYAHLVNDQPTKEMIELKKLHPNLHNWLKKLHVEIDTNGKKKLLAEKK